MKILIVEDEAALASVLRQELESSGATVAIAADGVEALEKARGMKPDFILCDLLMPNKDGFEVLRELKEDADLKHIPVMVLSVLGQDADIKKALDLGAVDYFVKTQHSLKEILEKVRVYMDKHPVKD